jgi:hypothetical protein
MDWGFGVLGAVFRCESMVSSYVAYRLVWLWCIDILLILFGIPSA